MSLARLLESLAPCQVHGTSFRDSGVRVSVRPEADEEISFYSIDTNSCPDCQLRRILGLEESLICDLIVRYKVGDRLILCLIELKGGNISHALDQIHSTYRAIIAAFNGELRREIIWRAYIKQHTSSPMMLKAPGSVNKYKQIASLFEILKISRDEDLAPILRR